MLHVLRVRGQNSLWPSLSDKFLWQLDWRLDAELGAIKLQKKSSVAYSLEFMATMIWMSEKRQLKAVQYTLGYV